MVVMVRSFSDWLSKAGFFASRHVVLLLAVIVLQILVVSLFWFQDPACVQRVIFKGLRDGDDEVHTVTIPARFLPLNQSDVDDGVRSVAIPAHFRPLNQSSNIFAFIHLRKSGGTTIRFQMYPYFQSRGGLSNTTTILISACKTVKCASFEVEDAFEERVASSNLPVWIVGHFSFSEVEKVTRWRNQRADCITQFRHPLNRTLSCFYYRSREERKPKNISNYSPSEFRTYMSNYKDLYGMGCNNEILRMFTAEKDEKFLNDPLRVDETKARKLIQVAKHNIAQCVVFLVGEAEQNRVIGDEFFPEFSDRTVEGQKANVQKYPEDTTLLDHEYFEVMLDQNKVDLELYEFGVWWHQQLYQFAARNKFFS